MNKALVRTSSKNTLNSGALLSALGLVTLLAVALWHNTGAPPIAAEPSKPASRTSMPNLRGERAKDYLNEQGLQQSLGEAIRAARYSVHWVNPAPIPNRSGAFQAHNSQQGYSSFFTNDEVHLVSRDPDENWRVALKLIGLGYGASVSTLSSEQWTADTTKIQRIWTRASGVSISESGSKETLAVTDSRLPTPDSRLILEWYDNRPEGLEQGFTINAPPERRPGSDAQSVKNTDSQLRLVLQIAGDLHARLAEDGQGLSFCRDKNAASILHYGQLKSTDAAGKELPSHFELTGQELSLLVDDSGATYPVTIDPLFTQTKKLTASDATQFAGLGSGVAISGDTVVVGAYMGGSLSAGTAYIFERNQGGADNWSEVKELTAPDADPSDNFGWSVAINGDTVIVGAIQNQIGQNVRQGSAYVYDRNQGGANNWGLVKELNGSDGAFNDNFGTSVATNGDTAIIGMANHPPGGQISRSAAYVFARDQGGPNNWGEVRIVSLTENQLDAEGYSVAMSGDTAVIGAPRHFNISPNSFGAALILERDAGGLNNWGLVKLIKRNQPSSNDAFGSAVAINGDKVLVGAGGTNTPGENQENAVYVFERNNGGPDNWGQVRKLVAPDDLSGNAFGMALTLNNDTAIVGAHGSTIGTVVQQGALYVFKQNAGGANNWGFAKKIIAADGAAGDLFGWNVALDGKTLAIGAPLDDGANTDQGSAYVFKSENDSWVEDVKPLAAGCTVDDSFGFSVSISGDTAVVGTFAADVAGNANEGAAYVFQRDQGGLNNWGLVKTLHASDGAAGDRFGIWVGISNDTIIAGAQSARVGGNNNQGAAYIFYRNAGGPNNWGEVKKLIASDGGSNDFFGGRLALSNDTAVIGSNNTSKGSAYIFERNAGGANNWGQVRKLLASDGALGDGFGTSVAIDVDTIVVGAAGDDIGNSDQGSAYVFDRNAGGIGNWGEVKKLVVPGGATNDRFGVRIAISGNTVIAGAPFATVGGNINQGYAYIFDRNTGGANSWGAVKKLVASDGVSFDNFGWVAISGDTAIVGASRGSSSTTNYQGSAYVFKQSAGGANNWGEVKELLAADGAYGDVFGAAVAISGDTVIVGAYGDDVSGSNGLGSAYVFVDQNGTWPELTQLHSPVPADCGTGDGYGWSVAISGDTVVIGAPFDDVGANTDQGSAYVLERNQGGLNNWGVVKVLLASDGATHTTVNGFVLGDSFGYSVAISGDSIVVGSLQATIGTNNTQGAAYIFERNAGGPNNWGEVKKLTASDGAADDDFGGAVSISDNTIIVGAFASDINGGSAQGAAYIFERNLGGANNWGEVKKLVAADGGPFDVFGVTVSIDQNTIIVSAYGQDVGGNSNQGAVYVFERNLGGVNSWGQVKRLTASDGAAEDFFGARVAVSDNTLVVGASGNNIGANVDQGSAYIFARHEGGVNNWGEVKRLVAADGAAGDSFGYAASISGDAVIVGAYLHDVGENTDQGSVYIFVQNKGGANNWGQVERLIGSEGSAGDGFGRAVAISGDDLIIGANIAQLPAPAANKQMSSHSAAVNNQGTAFLFRGNAAAPTAAAAMISGKVTDTTGAPLAGVLLTLTSGSSARHTITDALGNYSFTAAEPGDFYTVVPSLANYSFSPNSRSFSLSGNRSDAVFTAIPGSVNANPLDTSEYFVRQQYLDFLEREPDQAGWEYWTSQLKRCHGDAACLRERRIDVSAAFFIAEEFQASGLFIYDVYRSVLGRKPQFAEYSADRNHVVGGPNLDSAKTAFANSFVQRSEFINRYAANMTAESFIDSLLQQIQTQGVDLSGERGNLLSAYHTGANTLASRAAVVRAVADNETFKQSQYNQAFVLVEYFGYLRRDADPQGYDFWLNVLDSGERNNYRGMVCSFITSREYQLRFTSVATHANNECQ